MPEVQMKQPSCLLPSGQPNDTVLAIIHHVPYLPGEVYLSGEYPSLRPEMHGLFSLHIKTIFLETHMDPSL